MYGEILRRLRSMKGAKQCTVAKNAGISQQYYSQIEQNKTKISRQKYDHILTSNAYSADEIENIKKFLPPPRINEKLFT